MIEALSYRQILDYELRSSWWAPWVSHGGMQGLVARYFVWKIKRKRARYLISLHEQAKHELSGT